jgi:PAS domain S-box-containing protein
MLSMNRSAEALFGIDSEDISGQRFTVLLAEDSRSRALDYLEGLKENGVASVLNDGREVIGETGDGGRIPLFMTMGRLGTNSQPKYCAVLRDISTFKRAEKDFIEARRAAETASARKSDFLARISHEIRTPLSAIIGFAEIMHDERFGQLGNARYRDYLNDILKSGEHVLDLVNDLLDLSKIEAGRADLTFGEVDVNAVLLNAANVLQETANKGSVIVRLSLTSHLPAIVADERSLTQITLNILSNAIKFTPEGGQVIISSNRTPDGEVIIRVKDTGIGMSEGDIATALEPFRQVATSRKGGGTGLGLPLTKALVEANRASMAIRSARHKGTLVEITFPPTRVLADR